MVGISLLLYRHDFLGVPIYELGQWLTAAAALLTFWSMLLYLRAAAPYLAEPKS
jgi:CDP-diacylglycerol--glycerol-3-phosphate 3-phosphatidyltransferase